MIVLCHGHFDLLHYGHFEHLRLARDEAQPGGLLFVSLTSGKHMRKPGHPIFTDAERLKMIRAIRYVDFAFICDSSGPEKALDEVRPDIYVKGEEYEGHLPELEYCLARGIAVKFLGKKLYGSTKLALKGGLLQSA